jgi:hypothetical protein
MPKLIAAIENASPECVTIYAHTDEAGQRNALDLADVLTAHGIEVFLEGLAP